MATENKGQQQINPTAQKVKKNGGKAIGITIVVVILLALVYSMLSSFGLPQKVLPVATSSNGNITVAQYNYYYGTIFANYSAMQQYSSELDVDFSKDLSKQVCTIADKKEDGSYLNWQEYLEKLSLDRIYEVETLYHMATEAKQADLTEEEQKEIDDSIASMKEAAKTNGFSFDAFLRSPSKYGKGASEKLVREEMKKAKVADNYKKKLSDEQKDFTQEDYKAFYEKHKEDYDTLSLYYYKAKDEKTANEILKQLNDTGSNFDEVVKKADSTATTNLQEDTTYAAIKAVGVSEEDAKWICSGDRKANEKKVFKTITGDQAVVISIVKPSHLDTSNTVDIRHILVKPEVSEGATTSTDAQWNAAKKKAEDLLNEWKKGKKTAESFGELATKNSSDTGSTEKGGLYDHVKKGQMLKEFDAWIFDASRKTGDTGIVKTDVGYHVMYFVGTNTPYWEYQAADDIKTDAVNTKIDETKKAFNFKKLQFMVSLFTTHLPKDMV